jgi:hypothetical protein
LERGPLCECEAFVLCLPPLPPALPPPLGRRLFVAMAKAKESGSSWLGLGLGSVRVRVRASG